MYTIALNTFREIIRSRFFGVVSFFAIILFAGIIFAEILSLRQSEMIVPDFGLSFIEIASLLLILFLGNRLLSKEFEEKTIYLTLSRPIDRSKIIFGKFFGFSAVTGIFVIILSIILVTLIAFYGLNLSAIFFLSILGIFLKILILIALILFFSIFLSSGIATFGTLAVYIIAHGGYSLLEFAMHQGNEMMLWIGRGILFLFPNFIAINFKDFYHSSEIIFGNFSHFAIGIALNFLYLIIVL